MDKRPTEAHVAAILNAAWMVRHYARGGRVSTQSAKRRQAIQMLGLIVLEAFKGCPDFEPLLGAIVDGLRPKDDPPF